MFDISFYCNVCTRCMNHIFLAITILNETEREATLFDIIFRFTVMHVRYPELNFCGYKYVTWKQKEAVVFDIFSSYCNTGELTGVIKYAAVPFAELPDLCPPGLRSPHSRVEPTTEDASPSFAYLVLRKCSVKTTAIPTSLKIVQCELGISI